MADHTAIEWCDATFNPWVGCTKVSPGCDHCYAEGWGKRSGRVVWGPGQERKRTSPHNWRAPLAWNDKPFVECPHCGWRGEWAKADERQGACPSCARVPEVFKPARRRVFCASLADVFDNEVPPEWRVDLFRLIAATPNLDWLLLTKRIGNAQRMIEQALIGIGDGATDALGSWPWPHVWLGATIVNQEEADRDIPKLLATPAAVKFLSMEPLLGPVDLGAWIGDEDCHVCGDRFYGDALNRLDGAVKAVDFEVEPEDRDDIRRVCPSCGAVDTCGEVGPVENLAPHHGLDWVIVGGESGPKARPMHPDWARSLRNQCEAAGVPFLFKQWGEWLRSDLVDSETEGSVWRDRSHFEMRDLGLIHEFKPAMPPGPPHFACNHFLRVGKKAAGRLLDGRTHDGFPEARA